MRTPHERKGPRRKRVAGGPGEASAGTDQNRQADNIPRPAVSQEFLELLPTRRVRPATESEIDEAIRSYNVAVGLWNEQQRDPLQPLPRTLEAGRFVFSLGFTKRTRGVVATRTDDGVSIFLRTRHWYPFASGWSCSRHVLTVTDVSRADIRVPHLATGGREHE